MRKDIFPKSNTRPSSSNPFDDLRSNPNIKKSTSKTDWGRVVVNALKRAKFDEDIVDSSKK